MESRENKENTESIDTPEQSRAKIRAMRILGDRLFSSQEMEKRLLNKGEPAEIARGTVEWLEKIGAVNDREYAEAIVRHYNYKGYGIAKIKNELHRRGIPRSEWDEAMEALEGEDNDENDQAVQKYLEKKLGGSWEKDDIRRAVDALCRRGFDYEDARTAVSQYLESIEDI